MKHSVRLIFALLVVITVGNQKSFVDTAPSPKVTLQKGSPEVVPENLDANVRELENLKQTIGKTLMMIKTQTGSFSDVNGEKQGHADTHSEVKENGKLLGSVSRHVDISPSYASSDSSSSVSDNNVPDPMRNPDAVANVRTQIDIPAENIHKAFEQKLDLKDMKDVKRHPDVELDENNLDKYPTYGATSQYSPLDMAEYVFWTGDEKGVTLAIEEFLQEGIMSREEAIQFLQEIKLNLDYLQEHYSNLGLNNAMNHIKNQIQNQNMLLKNEEALKKNEKLSEMIKKNDKVESRNYDDVLERLRIADFLYTEYSLEEVIYQLAKIMFTQSMTRGSTEAQKSLQKFTTFLENEAELGHISRALEKKVLDVLIAALTDTLNEHPELNVTQENKSDEILRQILEENVKNRMRVPIGLGKYKTIR